MSALATIKCPFCEGKTNAGRKTLYLYSTDTYWCARCKAHGSTTEIEPDLLAGVSPKLIKPVQPVVLEYNNQGYRFSVCKQRHCDTTNDIFQIKLVDGSLVGHYYRKANKQSKIEGVKGFCYREQFLQFGTVYRLVEGVYDCIYPNDIAVLGFPTEFQAKQLKWFAKVGGLILCPDGDVWEDATALHRWLNPFRYYPNITVEYIPNKLDPDECKSSDRKSLSLAQILKWLDSKEK